MADRDLLTQTELDDIKFALNQTASNLAAHANDSLSKAHGINMFKLASPFLDAQGNDVSTYQDDHGNVLGDLYVRFSVGGMIYYAPAKTTALAGQPPNSGQIVTPSTNIDLSQRSSAWMTDFTATQRAAVDSVNGLLIAHSLLSHWETHGTMTAVTRDTFDSQGYRIGRNVIQFYFNGEQFEIPCDTRLGGPPQIARPVLNKYYVLNNRTGGRTFGNTIGSLTITCTVTGSGPFTFQWYGRVYARGTSIVDPSFGVDGQKLLTPGSEQRNGINSFDTNINYTITVAATSSVFLINNITTSNNYSDLKVWYWCRVTSPLGTADSQPFVFESYE